MAGYGGVPVVCDFVIIGPRDTAYEGGYFKLKVTFEPGYPYKIPTVLFSTRIFAVNIMTSVDGTGKLLHLDQVWDSRWNMRILLSHIVSLLINPSISLLPGALFHTLNAWLVSKGYDKITMNNPTSDEDDVSGNDVKETKDPVEQDQKESTNDEKTQIVSELHANDSHVEMLESMSRIEQMHLNVLSLFICDNDRYNHTIRQMTQLYASHNPLSHLNV